jgi:hypothetical protein
MATAAALCPVALPLLPAQAAAARGSFHKILIEDQDEYGLQFARSAQALSPLTAAIGDVATVWYDELRPLWCSVDRPIAGFTSAATLFCLEQLCAEAGRRVVFRVEHRQLANGRFEHRIANPSGGASSLKLGDKWPEETARVLHGLQAHVSPIHQVAPSLVSAAALNSNIRFTWIIARRNNMPHFWRSV